MTLFPGRPAALLALLLLGACGTLPRYGFDPAAPRVAAPTALTDVRFAASDTDAAMTTSGPIRARIAADKGDFTVLALSGGGANGAYGAGVLAGKIGRAHV